jgi:DNA-binding NarL/FixJ family response regulator
LVAVNGEGRLQVALVSPYALIRAGLTELIRDRHGQPLAAVSCLFDLNPREVDVVVYDLAALDQPAGSGQLRQALEKVTVLGVARDRREDLTDRARALGVQLVVPEHVTGPALLDALEQAAGRRRRPQRHNADSATLSDREREVLRLIGAGMSNREIADELYLSLNTVKTYIRIAYRKISVQNRPQAVLWTARNRLGSREMEAGPVRVP